MNPAAQEGNLTPLAPISEREVWILGGDEGAAGENAEWLVRALIGWSTDGWREVWRKGVGGEGFNGQTGTRGVSITWPPGQPPQDTRLSRMAPGLKWGYFSEWWMDANSITNWAKFKKKKKKKEEWDI